MQRVARTANGLLLSLIFSTFQCIQSKIQQNNCVYLFFQDMYRLIFIFLFSSIITFTNPSNKKDSYPWYLLFIAPLSDYLGILFLNKGFQVAPPFFIFFLDALIFPMDALYSFVLLNIETSITTVLIFC